MSGAEPSDWIFAILRRLRDPAREIAEILLKLATLPVAERREAIVQLLILSGLRSLKEVVTAEVKRMPITIDIHDNWFLEEVFQEGRQEGLLEGRLESFRSVLLSLLNERFGTIPEEASARIANAGMEEVEKWLRRVVHVAQPGDIFCD